MKFLTAFCLFFFTIHIVSAQCQDAKCIYTKGIVEDYADFRKVDSDLSKGYTEYVYVLDTFLRARVQYYEFKDRTIMPAGYSFYYRNRSIGKWTFLDFDGKISATVNMYGGKKNGYACYYKDGKIILKELYSKGVLVSSKKY